MPHEKPVSSNSGSFRTVPLTPAEEDRVLAGIDRFVELVRDVAKLTPADGEDTPELADRLIRWWHSQGAEKMPEGAGTGTPVAKGKAPTSPVRGGPRGASSMPVPRPTFDDVFWAVGCAVGDLLYHVLEVRWQKAQKGSETRFCLVGQRLDERIVLFPIDGIIEHWNQNQPFDPRSEIVSDYLDELYDDDAVRAFIAEG